MVTRDQITCRCHLSFTHMSLCVFDYSNTSPNKKYKNKKTSVPQQYFNFFHITFSYHPRFRGRGHEYVLPSSVSFCHWALSCLSELVGRAKCQWTCFRTRGRISLRSFRTTRKPRQWCASLSALCCSTNHLVTRVELSLQQRAILVATTSRRETFVRRDSALKSSKVFLAQFSASPHIPPLSPANNTAITQLQISSLQTTTPVTTSNGCHGSAICVYVLCDCLPIKSIFSQVNIIVRWGLLVPIVLHTPVSDGAGNRFLTQSWVP